MESADNPVKELSFQSSGELAGIFKSLGFDFEVSQLSPGPLQGMFHLAGSAVLPLLSITTNRMLVAQGDRKPGVLPFSIFDQRSG